VKTNALPPLHILFADDDSDESYLFNEALEHSGLDVKLSYANDGNSLLSFLQDNQLPDVVIIDINMPHKDGLEALDEIRKKPELKNLPLVIYSTSRDENVIGVSFKKGANLFVVKPDNFDGMVQVVKKVCEVDWKVNPLQAENRVVISEE